jgi:DNA helicase-2/ATP-dependent DNA helicase PcrA
MSDSRLFSPAELAHRLGEQHPPTAEQEAAIQAPLAPLAIVAGAGSGKTQTMGLRVVWLVANGLVGPHRVLGLTFTRKAAAQLGDRVRRMLRRLLAAHNRTPFLDDTVALSLRTGEPTVSTYHAYASSLVAEHALRAGVEPSARLLGEAITWQYSSEVVEAYDGPMESIDRRLATVTADVLALAGELSEHLADPADVLALTGQVRAHLSGLPRAPGQPGKGVPKPLADLLRALSGREELLPLVDGYARRKRERSSMDYSDQVALAARIARDHPAVGEIERARFSAVLLDEYQDTGEAQRVLLTSLFGGGHAMTAVGDPRQSIYGWRGASAGNLERFPADFPASDGRPAASSGLRRSFRNGERILAAANAIAAAIPVRGLVDRPLEPGAGREGAGQVVCALHETAAAEAAWIAARVAAVGSRGLAWGEIAVLARRRSQFPAIETQLRLRGVPCEVVGLGGLLLEPEVVDVVSTLRVLTDPTAGNAVVRLLTGPRWRLGPRDLDALGRRARRLALPPDAKAVPGEVDAEPDVVDDRSLVDALDDLGEQSAYSPAGYARLVALRDELRHLRQWTAAPLPDLVAHVARVLSLDVELAARPGMRPADALVHLDRFVEVAEEFVASGDDPGLPAFLAYLDAAEERERGLETEVAEPDGARVQLLTVHAAKGLEWDAVFVAGLTRTVFPVEGQPVADWTKQIYALPFPFRGDRSDLPELDWRSAGDQRAAKVEIERFQAACKERGRLEERRLAYVAVTRARDLLVCSGYWWDTAAKPRGPSEFLEEVRATCDRLGLGVGPWADPPADGVANPVTADPGVRQWPFDPLGPRRAAVERAAGLVAEARAGVHSEPELDMVEAARAASWESEVELLLAEYERLRAGREPVVEMPSRLSVSQLVTLRRDPAELAREIRRPMPARPRPLARRGTRFHLWLEQRWGQQRLIDLDELPGAADDSAEPDADLAALQDAFRRSRWWGRTPAEVEFPFDMVIEGVLLRGRVDAVFTDSPDGCVEVVDWKTGQRPRGAEAEAAAVQLAAYRLAWQAITATPLERVRAAFHYVPTNETVRPVDLLDADDLAALIRSVPLSEVQVDHEGAVVRDRQ